MSKGDDRPRRKIVVEEVGDVASTVEIISEPQNKEVLDTVPEVEVLDDSSVSVFDKPEPQLPEPNNEPIQEAPQVEQDEMVENSSTGPSPLVVVIPGLFLLGALLGGIIFYQRSLENEQGILPSSTETPLSVASVSPTTAPTDVDVTKYKVKVLNGSGIAGEAGKVQDLIEKEGFVVSTTGNASNYNYTETVIQLKSDVDSDFVKKLTETLSSVYKVSKDTADLSSSSGDDVVVIVGTSKE